MNNIVPMSAKIKRYLPDNQKLAENPLDRRVIYTWFPDQRAQRKREYDFSLRGLATRIENRQALSKEQLPFIKGARFGERQSERGCLRYNDNIEAITAIEADYDAGSISPEDASKRLRREGITALLYTTPSHQQPGKGHR